jgi:hypothetical protein
MTHAQVYGALAAAASRLLYEPSTQTTDIARAVVSLDALGHLPDALLWAATDPLAQGAAALPVQEAVQVAHVLARQQRHHVLLLEALAARIATADGALPG